MAANDKDKNSYQNGKSNFNIKKQQINITYPFPIYAHNEVVGFIALNENAKLPKTLIIRDRYYNIGIKAIK